MRELAGFLQQTALFQSLSTDVIENEIIPYGFLQSYCKDQFLIVPQQRVDRFGIMLSGKVHILHISEDGVYRLMRTIAEHETLGADLIYTKSQIAPYHAAAVTAVQFFSLPAAILTTPGFLSEETRSELVNRMLQLISQENMKKEYRLAILSQNGLRNRIMTYLTMQASRQQKTTFTIPFSRDELASFLCVNRSALSHELSLLQQEGVISFRKNVFTLHTLSDA